MEELGAFASVPAIMAVTWLAGAAWDWAITDPDGRPHSRKAEAFKPVLAGILGLFMGVVTYYTNPGAIHSDNVLAAAAHGITSGLASAGIRGIAKRGKAD